MANKLKLIFAFIFICIWALILYGNTFDNEFVFDDLSFIVDNPHIKEEYNKHLKLMSEKYETTGTKDYVDSALTKTSDKFDIISGQKMYDLVKDKLALQDKYNDLLATKLVEALNKVKDLETRISKLENKE